MRDQVERRYPAFIDTVEHVYDGDTIEKTHIRILELNLEDEGYLGEIYPQTYVKDHNLWVVTNVRLAGIDCPERHPHHRLADGHLRSESALAYEARLALEARNVVCDALRANHLQFEVRNPEIGKYAGRIVAEVWVNDVNLSQHLLDEKLAYPYDGGTKQRWQP